MSAVSIDTNDDIETGTIKFFNPTKGFGFVTSDDDGEDIYFHRKVLEKAGKATIAPGTTVRFIAEDDEDDKTAVIEIISIDASTATGPALLPDVQIAPVVPSTNVIEHPLPGMVLKWLVEKGYGFLVMENGDNVFVHKAVLLAEPLVAGERCLAFYARSEKGFVANEVWRRA